MGCAAAARVVLERIEGVKDADVSYEQGSGTIVYDPMVTSPDAFIPELEEMTGYQATLVADALGGAVQPEPDDPAMVEDSHPDHTHEDGSEAHH